MPNSANKQGYTILEVMIFLAISGFMFILAASFISGKQAKSEFRQSVGELNSQVQNVINDVSNGYYPTQVDFICIPGGQGAQPTFQSGGGGGKIQGDHQGCVFMGRAMEFATGGDPTAYKIYAIAGRQYVINADDGVLPTSFNEAKPVLVDGAGGVNLTENKTTKWGLEVSKVYDPNGSLTAFGFFSSFAKYSGNNTLVSGSQNVTVATLPLAGGAVGTQINSLSDSNIKDQPFITMCLKGNGQYATIVIGGETGQRLSTTPKIYGSVKPDGCPQ